MTKSRHPKTDPTRISFRIDAEVAVELASRAKQVGKSQGLYARDLLCEALFHGEEQRQQLAMIRAELVRLATSFDHLRSLPGDLASSVAVLLAHAGQLNPQQARQWAEKTLLHPKPREDE
jgi:hypothetical protein